MNYVTPWIAVAAAVFVMAMPFAPTAAASPSDLIITRADYETTIVTEGNDTWYEATFTVTIQNDSSAKISDTVYVSAEATSTAAYPSGFAAEEQVLLQALPTNGTKRVTFTTTYRVPNNTAEGVNVVFTVDRGLTAEHANLLEETNEDNNSYTRFIRIGRNVYDYVGDGTYDFRVGERVRLDSGMVVEPVVREENNIQHVYFTVFNALGAEAGTSETAIYASRPRERITVGDSTFLARYGDIVMYNDSPIATLTLTSVSPKPSSLPDLIVSGLELSDPNDAGDRFITLEVKNIGPAFVGEGRTVAVTVKNNNDERLYTTEFTTPFERGIMYESLRTNEPFAVSTEGTYSLTATIDTTDAIVESIEDNNTFSTDITVSGSDAEEMNGGGTDEKQQDEEEGVNETNTEENIAEQSVIARERKRVASVNEALARRLAGRILLQVEEHGEAWYVHPVTHKKMYLKNGVAAFAIMRATGLGITNADLAQIPVGSFDDETSAGAESALVQRLKGRIVLQVEERGEAWYVNPADGKRYFLGDPNAAYNAMRFLGLGIKNDDLRKIEVGEFSEE